MGIAVPLCAMLVVQPQPQQNNLMHFQESAMYMSPEPANPNQHNNQHNYASNPRANQQWQPTRSNQICRYWSQKGSCPNKHCPYSNTHTARNSPRYAKHMPAQQQPREGALEIKDAPSSVQDTAPSLPVSNQNNNQQSQSVTN